MSKVCRSCHNHLYHNHGLPTAEDRCRYEASRDVVTGEYLNAETCEEMRKPGRQCGPTGRKWGGLGW